MSNSSGPLCYKGANETNQRCDSATIIFYSTRELS